MLVVKGRLLKEDFYRFKLVKRFIIIIEITLDVRKVRYIDVLHMYVYVTF